MSASSDLSHHPIGRGGQQPVGRAEQQPVGRGDLKRCALCLSDYEAGELKSQLNCGHVFHSDCLTDMRRRCSAAIPNLCPLGRERITSINGEPVEPIERLERNEEQIHEDEMLALQLQNRWQMDPQAVPAAFGVDQAAQVGEELPPLFGDFGVPGELHFRGVAERIHAHVLTNTWNLFGPI